MIDEDFGEEEEKLPLGKILIAIVLMAVIGGIALYATNPTMFTSLPFAQNPNQQESENQQLSAQNGSIDINSQKNEMVFKQINIETDFNSENYVMAFEKTDITVNGSVAIEEAEKEKLNINGDNIELKNFSGNISRKNSKTILSGSIDSVSGPNSKAQYLEKKVFTIEINGSASVNNTAINSFDSNISGKIKMPGIELNFDNAILEFSNFKGNLAISGSNMKLNGMVEELKAQTQLANVQIN